METLREYFNLLMNSEQLITTGGLSLLTFVVFAETGIFFLFFLPGDYLLFTAGLLCAPRPNQVGILDVPLWFLMICLYTAAVLGNLTGYLFGRFLGHRFETMRESFFFKREYLENTRKAFEKYGANALVIGRFLPVIRTFAAILAGMSRYNFSRFMLLNLAGGAAWVASLTSLGYYLGQAFPQIVHYLEYIIIAFVAITSLILVRSFRKIRAEQAAEKLTNEQKTKE